MGKEKRRLVRRRNVSATFSAAVCGVAVALVAVILVVTGAALGGAKAGSDTNLPKLEINLVDVPIEIINAGGKATKYAGNVVNLTVGDEVLHFENVELKGRGNSTWGQVKKPYRIKLDQKTELFGMGRAKKWVLLANYLDDSFLRNDLSFYMMRMLDTEFQREGEFVELYIDGGYYGLYFVTRATEVSKTMVDLRDPMAVIVELDNLYNEGEEVMTETESGDFLVAKDVVAKDNEVAAFESFVEVFEEFAEAAADGDYGRVTELADLKSFAKYYLLNEFAVNPDAYATSFFMYKDGEEDKIHAGPEWDFDFAFGNRKWVWTEDEDFHSPTRTRAMEARVLERAGGENAKKSSMIMYNLLKMPEFEELVREVFKEQMAGRAGEIVKYLETEASRIESAAIRDGERWKKDTFFSEVEYLIDWVVQRYEYFEEVYGGRGSDERVDFLPEL